MQTWPQVFCLLMGLMHAMAQPPQMKVLAPSGDVEVVDTDSDLNYIDAPSLAPSPSATQNDTAADCITSADTFWGADFVSTERENTTSAADCCSKCKLANDCTAWNWCSKESGCGLPPNMAAVNNASSFPYQSCIWKPRPVTFAGTLPLPPDANMSSAMKGWISGIPINGTLIPNLDGFQLHTGIELDYSVENDFYCQGSTTTKPVCQLYGSAKGGAAACLNNPVCRGYQICWSFPVWGSSYQESAIIRMKGGLGPLNVSSALQNPYCSIYTIEDDVYNNPNGTNHQYALRNAYNGTAAEAYYQYASTHPNSTTNSSLAAYSASGIVNSPSGNNNRRLLQDAASPSINVPIDGGSTPVTVTETPAVATPAQATNLSTNTAVQKPRLPAIVPVNFTTPFLEGRTLQAFPNVTFNYTKCYSNSASMRVTLQPQLFPLFGPQPLYSIHTWTEKPFRSSATTCCAFQAVNDIYLNLENGVIATSPSTYVATNVNLTNGAPVRNYETSPSTVATPIIYIPNGQLNNPGGTGRQYAFPRINSTDYVNALERLFFSLSQVSLGDLTCSPGFPQLANALEFVGDLINSYSEEEDENESPGGIPTGLQYLNALSEQDASSPPVGCLIDEGVEFDGDVLQTVTGNQTRDSCCSACWLYSGKVSCDIWILNTETQSCELRNNTAAANLQYVETLRDESTTLLVSGRRTGIQPRNSTIVFVQSL